MTLSDIQSRITQLFAEKPAEAPADFPELLEQFLSALESGDIRSAEKTTEGWRANAWVKEGILLGFKYGVNQALESGNGFYFYDKNTYPTQATAGAEKNIRIVPGGSSVRRGAFIGANVTMMPPMYVNVGAYVDEGTMVDSHALVGSCAQVGKNVHLSAAAQLGGVLEPINATPVIVEDECMVGGNTGIFEGTQVLKGAVIGSGVILTRSTPVFDLVHQTVIRGSATQPLVIPEGAVVIPGSRAIKGHDFAEEHGLAVQTPLIVKYRDDKTDAATKLEALLR
jgi:2,3,4,5-tetrahydropyridine-2-carboxylate N-succinyltransferase